MSWVSVKHVLEHSLSDFSAEVAYRSAARIVPQIADSFSMSRLSKERETPAIQAILRGLMTARVCNDGLSADLIVAAKEATENLDRFSFTYAYVIRATRASLVASSSIKRPDRVYYVRIAIQAAVDAIENTFRYEKETEKAPSYLDIWQLSQLDVNMLEHGVRLPAILDQSYIKSNAWESFERHLLTFDESWAIWVYWLQFRLFGMTRPEIPALAFVRAERLMAVENDEIWTGSELILNATFSKLVIAQVEALLDEEAEREQSDLGVKFSIVDDAIIDVGDTNDVSSANVITSVVKEVKRNAKLLLDSCKDNSEARLKERVIDYISAFNDDTWHDEMLVVMRGDTLRKELQFQNTRTEDSDIPPYSQLTLQNLDQTSRLHNLLVNSHDQLSRLDKLLASPGSSVRSIGLAALKDLVVSAEKRHAISSEAKLILEAAQRDIAERSSDTSRIYNEITFENFVRTAVSFMWKRRAIVGVGFAVASATYSIGSWLVANQTIIMRMFAENSTMTLVLKRLYDILQRLPLL